MNVLQKGGLLLAAGLLAACASRGPQQERLPSLQDPQALAAAEAQQATRAMWLRSRPAWSFEGRVAISQAGKGGNGRLDWQQQGQAYTVALSAPVTRQSWRLDVDAQGARLNGLEGGERVGPDATDLLLQATGWQIPVGALADWARGLASPATTGTVEYGLDGQPQLLQQDGWTIRYSQWQTPVGAAPSMPRRIEAERGDARVRLIIDAWQLDPEG